MASHNRSNRSVNRLLRPSSDTTATIPATAFKVLSVGAYNQTTESVAAFSGRGFTADGRLVPLVVAAGVDVLAAGYGGGYVRKRELHLRHRLFRDMQRVSWSGES